MNWKAKPLPPQAAIVFIPTNKHTSKDDFTAGSTTPLVILSFSELMALRQIDISERPEILLHCLVLTVQCDDVANSCLSTFCLQA